jgi:hypothetical protein
MSRNRFRRAALAAVLGLGVWAGLARAGGIISQVPPACTEQPPGGLQKVYTGHPVRDWCHNHPPLGCWSSFNTYTCSSLHSETAFIFGSCKTFFGEPCLKVPPPSPLPPWIQPPPGVKTCRRCAQP